MSNVYTRREWLTRGAASVGAAALAVPYVMAQSKPGDKLGVAVIGAGGMGGYSVDCALLENLVALVDVDEHVIAGVMKDKVKDRAKPKIFHDFRKMLDECHREIDVVLIATPDHTHAPAAIRAIDLGKHTFCQKPLAHNIRECYVLAKAAKQKKVLTQMGNQGQFSEGMRRMAEYIEAGAIGPIVETHSILGRNFGGKGGRPPSKPVPAHLHWDEWLGPAPYRDYHEGLHPFNWRSWRAFGTGTIGDMACHNVNPVFWGLKLGEVKRFTVTCLNTTGGSDEMYPQDNIVLYEIPARPGKPAAKVYVYDHAGLKPEVMKEAEKKYNRQFGEFTLFVGEKGMMGSDGRILPEEAHKKFPSPPKTYPRAHGGPVEDLYYCIKNGGVPASNFPDAATPLTAFALCGHLAQFAGIGKKIEWDVEAMKCTNLPEINQYVARTYRKGWEV
ncbi:MAG: Gfo/Idh/MocA family oxidoreductase [Thermoguttaceae bacterium]|nr:Gfo/Idh/MocA family oxidoreductase [Thermoguttaceae bacterium]